MVAQGFHPGLAACHRHRVVDIIHTLEQAGFRYLSVTDIEGLLQALSAQEQTDSMELASA